MNIADVDFSLGFFKAMVILLTFRESLPPLFFLIATSSPLQASKLLVLQAPSFLFGQVSLSFLLQSSEKLLSRCPVSQQLRELFSLQISSDTSSFVPSSPMKTTTSLILCEAVEVVDETDGDLDAEDGALLLLQKEVFWASFLVNL